MKSLIRNRKIAIIKIAIIVLALFELFQSSYATENVRERSVFAYVLNGAVVHTKPSGAASVKSISIQNLCDEYYVESVLGTFPDFDQADTIRSNGVAEFTCINRSKVFTFILSDSKDVGSFMKDILDDSDVVYVQLDLQASVLTAPDDPDYGSQWNLDGSFNSMDMARAWNSETGGTDVVVGILDYGYAQNQNNDLNNMWDTITGEQTTNSDLWYAPGSAIAHAFAVAGISSAETDNDYLIAGCDYNGHFSVSPLLIYEQWDRVIALENYLDNSTVKIWNVGWEWTEDDEYDAFVADILNRAYMQNHLVVCAAGNSQTNQSLPGKLSCTFTVGGYEENGEHYGRISDYINLVAPASNLLTTQPSSSGSTEITVTGTSFSAAEVSGIASLIWNHDTDFKNDDVANIMMLSAVPMGAGNEWGEGRVNASRALEFVDNMTWFDNDITFDWNEPGATSWTVDHTGRTQMAMNFQGLDEYYIEVTEYHESISMQSLCGRTFTEAPYVWGRGSESTGLTLDDPNFGTGYTKVVSVVNGTLHVMSYKLAAYQTISGGTAFWTSPTPSYAVTVAEKNTPFAIDNLQLIEDANHHPELTWEVKESDVGSFKVYRAVRTDQNPHPSAQLIGTTTSSIYVDDTFSINSNGGATAIYTVKVVDSSNNWSAFSNPVSTDGYLQFNKSAIVQDFAFHGIYPNPANLSTTFSMRLPATSNTEIFVYNIRGRQIRKITMSTISAGEYRILWNAKDDEGKPVASGVYFYRVKVKAGPNQDACFASGKMVLLK